MPASGGGCADELAVEQPVNLLAGQRELGLAMLGVAIWEFSNTE